MGCPDLRRPQGVEVTVCRATSWQVEVPGGARIGTQACSSLLCSVLSACCSALTSGFSILTPFLSRFSRLKAPLLLLSLSPSPLD